MIILMTRVRRTGGDVMPSQMDVASWCFKWMGWVGWLDICRWCEVRCLQGHQVPCNLMMILMTRVRILVGGDNKGTR